VIAKAELHELQSRFAGESKPVLMACIQHDHADREQVESLTQVQAFFDTCLRIYVLPEGAQPMLKQEFGIEGSPAFIIFSRGAQQGRLLGKADSAALATFIKRTLLSIEAA